MRMDKYRALENIANGIYTSMKLKELQRTAYRKDSLLSATENNPSIIVNDILQSIAEHSPRNLKDSLKNSSRICRLYCETYRNLKHYIRTEKNQGITKHKYVKSLSILEPLLDNRKKAVLDKIIKIYNIFD